MKTEEDIGKAENGRLRCLECGASLPIEAISCHECGNDRLIMPERWTSPDETHPGRKVSRGWLSSEIRVLLGLTLSLLCALVVLGSARNRVTEELNGGKTDTGITVSMLDGSEDVDVDGTALDGLSMTADNLDAHRAVAMIAEGNGAWLEAAESWAVVTSDENATLQDFLSQAKAHENAQDPAQALETYNRAIIRFPNEPDAYKAIGSFLESRGSTNEAWFYYQEGLTYNPNDRELLEGSSRCESGLGLEGEPVIEEPSDSRQQNETSSIDTWPSGFPELTASESAGTESQPAPQDRARSTSVEQPQEPALPQESTTETAGPVTLIGNPDDDRVVSPGFETENTEPVEDTEKVQVEPINVTDVNVEATADRVIVELVTDAPAEISTRSASDPQRLVIRLPNAIIAPGSGVARTINLNVPLIDRVSIMESESDEKVVILVLYLGQYARYTVNAEAFRIRVILEHAQE